MIQRYGQCLLTISKTYTSRGTDGIKERFEKAMLSDSVRCIGTYVFLWGQKQERTPTWYGLFTENNEAMESIDVMHYFWNDNQWPSNRTPRIINATLEGKRAVENVHVNGGEEITFSYETKDPDGDELTIRFEVMQEATDLQEGGDIEERPEGYEDLLVSQKPGEVIFKSPNESGAYRAFLYVLDGNGHAGTVNIPFYVD